MTGLIEERLRDAFTAGAELVRPGTLRPLSAPRRRARAFVPLAAAAAVTAMGVGGVALAMLSPPPGDPAPRPAATAGEPAPSPAATAGEPVPSPHPGTLKGLDGAELRLLHSETHDVLGKGVTVTFQPTSVHTGQVVRCAEPGMWVLIRAEDRRETSMSPCETGEVDRLDAQHSKRSVTPDWRQKPQRIEIWILSPDMVNLGVRKFLDDYHRIKDEIVPRTGMRWTVSLYDRP